MKINNLIITLTILAYSPSLNPIHTIVARISPSQSLKSKFPPLTSSGMINALISLIHFSLYHPLIDEIIHSQILCQPTIIKINPIYPPKIQIPCAAQKNVSQVQAIN